MVASVTVVTVMLRLLLTIDAKLAISADGVVLEVAASSATTVTVASMAEDELLGASKVTSVPVLLDRVVATLSSSIVGVGGKSVAVVLMIWWTSNEAEVRRRDTRRRRDSTTTTTQLRTRVDDCAHMSACSASAICAGVTEGGMTRDTRVVLSLIHI